VVTLALTVVLRGATSVRDDADQTRPQDYDELAEDTVYPLPAAAAPVA
jgi:hypothetical protein